MADINFKNRTLFHGDNLRFLRALNTGAVDLIASDPPFKKGRDFHATPSSLASGGKFQDRWSWDKDVYPEWIDKISDDFPRVMNVIMGSRSSYGDDMGAFLCFMAVRLLEMHRVLKPTGSIYLHCDHTASHYLKELMDAIFGQKNFRNEIIWAYNTGGNTDRWFSRKHDVLLFYSKTDKYTFNTQREKSYTRTLPEPHTNSGKKLNVLRDEICELCEEGRPGQKYRMVKMRDVWSDIKPLFRNDEERYGWPTQKPLALYRRIIQTSSNEGDMVLDPFCGCATTPVAAEHLGRQWVGIDIWDKAFNAVIERMEKEYLSLEGVTNRMFCKDNFFHVTVPPDRTDNGEEAVPFLYLKVQRPLEPWQRMRREQMVNVLALAQNSNGGVICAGCGRVLEVEFMELDHIQPRAEGGDNFITNRILLCSPCNRRKRENLTLRGLVNENKKKKVGWMKAEGLARMARESALQRADWVRDNFNTKECQDYISGKANSLPSLF